MVRSHPQWLLARSLIREGRIGDVRALIGVFSYLNDNPANIRNMPEWGGGALMDIGCYLINTSRFLLGREPVRASGCDRPRSGTEDRSPDVAAARLRRRAPRRHVQHADGPLSAHADLRIDAG